jgi:hypothetical protein
MGRCVGLFGAFFFFSASRHSSTIFVGTYCPPIGALLSLTHCIW